MTTLLHRLTPVQADPAAADDLDQVGPADWSEICQALRSEPAVLPPDAEPADDNDLADWIAEHAREHNRLRSGSNPRVADYHRLMAELLAEHARAARELGARTRNEYHDKTDLAASLAADAEADRWLEIGRRNARNFDPYA